MTASRIFWNDCPVAYDFAMNKVIVHGVTCSHVCSPDTTRVMNSVEKEMTKA